jgi:hypothetical protein
MLENYEKCYVKAMTFDIHDKALKLSDDWVWLFVKEKVGFAYNLC